MDFSQFTILNIIELAGWVVAGALALFGVYNRQKKSRETEDDRVASNLIANLRATTDLQEKELEKLRAKEVEQGKQIAHLEGQVKVLSEILQGRDPATKDIMSKIPEIYKVGVHNTESIEKLTKTMSEFMEKLTNILPPKEPMKL
jgi:uncharacterized coiled-coil protein SlyX